MGQPAPEGDHYSADLCFGIPALPVLCRGGAPQRRQRLHPTLSGNRGVRPGAGAAVFYYHR